MRLFMHLNLFFLSFSSLCFAMSAKNFQKAFVLSEQGESLQAAKQLIYALPYETEEGLFIAEEFINWISASPSSMTRHFNAATFYLFHQNKEKAKQILIQDFEETSLEVLPFVKHLLNWMEETFASQKASSSLKTWLLRVVYAHAEEHDASIVPCGGSVRVSGSMDEEGNKEGKAEIRYQNEKGNVSIGGSASVSQDKEGNRKNKVEGEFVYRF